MRRPALAMAGGMALFGVIGALGIAASPWIALTLIAFGVTGVANVTYSVHGRTALMQRAPEGEQGSVMSTRYSIAQANQILGLGVGALVAAVATARGAFVLVGHGTPAFAALLTLDLRRRASRRRRRAGTVNSIRVP